MRAATKKIAFLNNDVSLYGFPFYASNWKLTQNLALLCTWLHSEAYLRQTPPLWLSYAVLDSGAVDLKGIPEMPAAKCKLHCRGALRCQWGFAMGSRLSTLALALALALAFWSTPGYWWSPNSLHECRDTSLQGVLKNAFVGTPSFGILTID